MSKHVGIYWNPTPSGEDVAAAKRWASDAGTALDIIVEQDREKVMDLVRANLNTIAFVVAKAGTADQPSGIELLSACMKLVGPHLFTILYSFSVSRNAAGRLNAADAGVHMVTHRDDELVEAMRRLTSYPTIEERRANESEFKHHCPLCGMACLDAKAMWQHMPMYHVNVKKQTEVKKCPICGEHSKYIVVHIHDEHAPQGHQGDTSRSGIPLYAFGLAVIRRKSDGKFLVVQEYSSQGYWLPGGGIDAGEMPDKATLRECIEEVGVKVKLTGVLRVEVSPYGRQCRMRYIFFGEPEDEQDCEPKTIPDFESAGACWVTYDEIKSGSLRLRGGEPLEWFGYVANGGKIHDLDLLTYEGAPAPDPASQQQSSK